MKKIIAICLLMIISMGYNTSIAVIHKICFNGLQRISLETALFYFPLKVGDIIGPDDIANSIKVLFATGYFEFISISNNDTNSVVTITVEERPVINSIKIQGNKIIKSDTVYQILDLKKIKSGELLNNYVIFETKNELKNICHSLGKFNAIIKVVSVFLTKNKVDLQVSFFEGKTAKINRIDIFGNYDFSEKEILKQFKIYNRFRWKNILFSNKYNQQKLLHDLENLRIFYLNRGYAKFYIDDAIINFIPDTNNVNCTVYITEGIQYSFKSLIIRGNVLRYIPEIKEYIQICSGELYNNNKIKEINNKVRYILGCQGYTQPVVSMEYDFNDYEKTITLYMYVDVNKRLYVRETRVEGNTITKDSVIRREIQQIEHTPLNYDCLVKDRERLKRLNYFKSIDIYIEDVPNLSNQVNIIYKIKEHNTGNLNCSLGFGTESGLNMQIGVYQENLLGSGNSISVTAIKNHYQTYIDILMLKRYLGIYRSNISGKMFYNKSFSNKLDLLNYHMKNYGFNINYLYPITEYETYNIGFDYISTHLNRISPQIAIWRYLKSVGFDTKIVTDNGCLYDNIHFHTDDFLLVFGWIFNDLNHIYFPKFGSHIKFTSKLTLPGSYNQYYKIMLDNTQYMPLDNASNWILMSNLFFGYSRGLFEKENPFYDNFYVGGIGSVRGFRLNSIGPKAVYYRCTDPNIQDYSQCSIEDSKDAVGGNAGASIKHELIIPIFCVNNTQYTDIIRMSVFIDAGTVWDMYWKNTVLTRAAGILDYSIFGHIRVSSGISLKWISPIGPVIFSYSKLLKKYPGDLEEPFQFSIGKPW